MAWVLAKRANRTHRLAIMITNPTNQNEEYALVKISIDMHLRSFRVVRQIEHSTPQPPQRFEPERFYGWLQKQKAVAARVVVCYEAGCFGYEPARRMQALGVEVLVIAPQQWDEQGKRQVNDKHAALVMCRRLSDYLDGYTKLSWFSLIPVRLDSCVRFWPLAKSKHRAVFWAAESVFRRTFNFRGWRSRTAGGAKRARSITMKHVMLLSELPNR